MSSVVYGLNSPAQVGAIRPGIGWSVGRVWRADRLELAEAGAVADGGRAGGVARGGWGVVRVDGEVGCVPVGGDVAEPIWLRWGSAGPENLSGERSRG